MRNIVFALLILTLSHSAFAFMAQPMTAYPQIYQQPWQNNFSYWGQPWGYQRPMYFYPNLPYHGMWMPQQHPYFFQQHAPSPYAPYSQCPTCGGTPYVPQMFPPAMVHPGGGVS